MGVMDPSVDWDGEEVAELEEGEGGVLYGEGSGSILVARAEAGREARSSWQIQGGRVSRREVEPTLESECTVWRRKGCLPVGGRVR